jgi:putative transposase
MHEKAKELVALLSEECGNLEDVQTLLKNLFKGTIERMLEAEMDEHLGYEKHSVLGNNSGNSRNGYGKKVLKTELGEMEIEVPRDRNGEFSPRVIEKRQTRSDDLENRILAMYAKGMANRDIEDHLRDIYGGEASASLISRITDKILPAVQDWQSRPLDAVYPIVFLDGIVSKSGKTIE